MIDRNTGDATLTTSAADDTADFTTRMRELRDSLPDTGDIQARIAAAVCDRCGARAELDFDNPQMPPGWAALQDGDFCPRCQSLN